MRISYFWRVILALAATCAVLLTASHMGSPIYANVPASVGPMLINKQREMPQITRPTATAYMIWTAGSHNKHEVWYRISGGDALFRQRFRVYKENAPPRAQNMLPPANKIVQELTSNQLTTWYVLGPETGNVTYYIDGDHRTGWDKAWEDDRGVVMTKTIYENGEFYHIGFEDRVVLDDYNDLEIEVAVIYN